jgi:hypothetical protein
VLIDAGSSGSRVYVYQWVVNRREMHNTEIDLVPGYVSEKTNPGTLLFTSALTSTGKATILVNSPSQC